MFLLGTDHIGIMQRRTQPESDRLWRRIAAYPPEAFYTSISFHEQVLGWNGYLNRNLTDFRQVPGLRVEDWTT